MTNFFKSSPKIALAVGSIVPLVAIIAIASGYPDVTQLIRNICSYFLEYALTAGLWYLCFPWVVKKLKGVEVDKKEALSTGLWFASITLLFNELKLFFIL